MALRSTPYVKALILWATGKRLTNHLPKLNLITLYPPGTDRTHGTTCHQHVVPISGDKEVFFRFLTWENKIILKFVFMADVGFELTTNDPRSLDDAIC